MRRNGFTLIELIVVIVIIGITTAASATLLVHGLKAYITAKNAVNLEWQGSVALERMSREIRSLTKIIQATSQSITFIDFTGTSITYGVQDGELMRSTQDGSQLLASGIQRLVLGYDRIGTDINYITITLEIAYGSSNFNLTTSVFPWNLTS